MRKMVTVILIGLLSLVAGGFLLNAYEVALSPGAAAALKPPRTAIPDRENAYFALLAFEVADAPDLQARGELLNKFLNQVNENNGSYTGYDAESGKEVEFKGNPGQLCSMGHPAGDIKELPQYDCIASTSDTTVFQMLDDNALLVSRFLSLAHYTGFQDLEDPRFDAPVISWPMILNTSRLLLTRQAIEIRNGHVDQALDWLVGNQHFWRMILASQESDLLDKMIAARGVVSDLSLVSDILRTQTLTAGQYERIGRLLEPFGSGELDLGPTLWYEWRGTAATLSHIRKQHALVDEMQEDDGGQAHHPILGRLANHFFSYNHQLNKYYARMSLITSVADAPTAQFLELKQALPARFAAIEGNPVWNCLYDPVGNALYRMNVTNDWTDSIAQLKDLEVLRRAIALQLEISRRQLVENEIASFVANAGSAYVNPYTGTPMHFDPATDSLDFMVQNSRDEGWNPLPLGSRH